MNVVVMISGGAVHTHTHTHTHTHRDRLGCVEVSLVEKRTYEWSSDNNIQFPWKLLKWCWWSPSSACRQQACCAENLQTATSGCFCFLSVTQQEYLTNTTHVLSAEVIICDWCCCCWCEHIWVLCQELTRTSQRTVLWVCSSPPMNQAFSSLFSKLHCCVHSHSINFCCSRQLLKSPEHPLHTQYSAEKIHSWWRWWSILEAE